MDSREMYKAAEYLGSTMTWEKDWIYFGTGDEIQYDFLKRLFEDHLEGDDFLFIYGRKDSGQFKKEEFFPVMEKYLGKENFELWSLKMDKAIQFNKIGVLLLGKKK